MSQKSLKYEQTLANLVEFDPEELEINAQGEMSESQRAKLEKQRSKGRLGYFVSFIFGVLVLGVYTFLIQNQPMVPQERIFVSVLAFLFMLIPLLLAIQSFLKMRPFRFDLRDNQVEQIEGRIHLDFKQQNPRIALLYIITGLWFWPILLYFFLKRANNTDNDYLLTIADQEFKIKKSLFLALKNGDPYSVYYAPHSREILSLEWLRDDQPFISDQDEAHAFDEAPKRLRQNLKHSPYF